MFDILTGELLDLTASVKGKRHALYAYVTACSSCCTSCGRRTDDE
jgi:hypothetical protein